MHYYQFNIGDYRREASHLSPIEHYIYRELIDTYFLTESPIPNETQSVIRRLRLGSDSVFLLENVLKDFFVLRDSFWHHNKIDEEIAKYQLQSEKNRKNGKNGGRPKTKNNPVGFGSVIDGMPSGCHTKPSDNPNITLTKNQEPLTKEPLTREESTRAPESFAIDPLKYGSSKENPRAQAGDVCRLIKAAGIPNCNPSHPDFLKLLDAGATQDEFYHATQAAISKGKASFAYVIGMVKGQREDAAKLVLHQGAMPSKPQSQYAESMERTRQQVFGSDEEVFGRQIFSKGEFENGNIIDAE